MDPTFEIRILRTTGTAAFSGITTTRVSDDSGGNRSVAFSVPVGERVRTLT